ncbi:MAG TPA: hypothetical protein VNX18_10250 [Bryobacteraceae bacterium]|jgi:hypothetical protein|nr:hypothetical protein [Bryobacteraceae bacterium]
MSNPLESSHRKLARAEEHIRDLEGKINAFAWSNAYEKVIEPHPDKPDHLVHKIKLTKEIPESIVDVTADAVQNLRNALDNAGYAVAIAAGAVNPLNTAFPFAPSVDKLANVLGRSKDIPEQIQSLFCGFQPYPGGNDLLWSLNEICVSDKHKMLIPVGTGVVRAGADVRGTGFFCMPNPHFWDRTKNEMELITLGPNAEFNYNFDFRLFVAFNDIKIVDGKPVLAVLYEIDSIVERILVAIEAEARRIKIFK